MCTTCTFYQLKVQGGMPLFIEIQNIKFQISYYYYYYYIEQLLSSHPLSSIYLFTTTPLPVHTHSRRANAVPQNTPPTITEHPCSPTMF
jgi:hypothetical protein